MPGIIEDQFKGIAGIERTTPEFRAKLTTIAGRLGAPPRDLARVISFESGGSFSPSKMNNLGSGCVGLIQFHPRHGARLVGKTVAQLKAMTAEEQLDCVELYFRKVANGRPLRDAVDLYMTVLYPVAVGRGPNAAILTKPGEYAQNRGLDINRDGVITAGEATTRMLGRAEGRASARVPAGYGTQPLHDASRPRASQAARRRAGADIVEGVPPLPAAPLTVALTRTPAARPASAEAPQPTPTSLDDLGDAGVFAVLTAIVFLAADYHKQKDPGLAARYQSIGEAMTALLPDERVARAAPDASPSVTIGVSPS